MLSVEFVGSVVILAPCGTQMEALLRGGVNVDSLDKEGLTPLMQAARAVSSSHSRRESRVTGQCGAAQGAEEAVCVLIQAGACLDALDPSHWTALHHAAAAGRPLVVEVAPHGSHAARHYPTRT